MRHRKGPIASYDTFKGHGGPVTSLHFHPAGGPVDFGNLVLSTSTDWTVKLWRVKVRKTANGPDGRPWRTVPGPARLTGPPGVPGSVGPRRSFRTGHCKE